MTGHIVTCQKIIHEILNPTGRSPPTHAIAGTRARAVTMATVRPPSLLNHSRRLASCRGPCATTLSSLDAAVVTRRRRQVTSLAFPSGGARQRARLYTSNDSLSTPRPTPSPTTAAPAPSMQTAPTAARASRLFAHVAMCAETCNWASDADCDDGGPGSGSARPGPTACGTGPSSHVEVTKV